MGRRFNIQQPDQPAGTSGGALPNQPNISSAPPPSDLINDTNCSLVDQRIGTLKTTTEKNERKKAIDKAYREKKKQEVTDLRNEMKGLADENQRLMKKKYALTRELALLKNTYQSNAKEMHQLRSDLDKLKQDGVRENAIERQLLKIMDFKELIKEKCKTSTQDPSPSYEEIRHSEEENLAGTGHVALDLDGDDSGDKNDNPKRKNKRPARSAPSGRHAGKVPKVENLDELKTRQVTLAAKEQFYDARAERHASSSNPPAIVDPYSITECLRILGSMGGIGYPTLKKAKALFESPWEREFFVGLTREEWRRGWVEELEKNA